MHGTVNVKVNKTLGGPGGESNQLTPAGNIRY